MDCVEYSGFAYGFLFVEDFFGGGAVGVVVGGVVGGTVEDDGGGFVVGFGVVVVLGTKVPGWRGCFLCDVEGGSFVLGERSLFGEFAGEFVLFLGTGVVVVDGNVGDFFG